ncbi:MAG: hypothetical protein J6R85_03550 [Lentisphaeria bacterium]|nr:hypothetical protein [Lentisphaeria bacterium]
MLNFFKIADNTFKESIREPIYFLMLLCALLLIGHFPSMALFVFYEQLKLVVDSSMATALFFGLLCAVLCASNTVSREMRNGTVLLMMSKPVSRVVFILAKIAGIVTAATLFSVICNLAALVSVYIAVDQFRLDMSAYYTFLVILVISCGAGMAANYWKGSAFSATSTMTSAGLMALYALFCVLAKDTPAIHMSDLVIALILINFSVIAMSTLAVVFATRLDSVANLTLCSFIFFAGLVSGYLFSQPTDSAVLDFIFKMLYAVIPNWQFFWLADAIAANRDIPASYLGWAAAYVALFVVICTMWAAAIFQNKEIAGDVRQ